MRWRLSALWVFAGAITALVTAHAFALASFSFSEVPEAVSQRFFASAMVRAAGVAFFASALHCVVVLAWNALSSGWPRLEADRTTICFSLVLITTFISILSLRGSGFLFEVHPALLLASIAPRALLRRLQPGAFVA